MTAYRWVCETCGHEAADGPAVRDHSAETGHIGAHVEFDRDEPTGELPPLFRGATS